ncbi:flavin reductase family protein [Rhizobium puerariae]|uniref:Flavin reductase family protein n=1 Tax=Rhizobium puerariae TaxID=1585791 RepID=A0ABV6AGJ3_9HYPH
MSATSACPTADPSPADAFRVAWRGFGSTVTLVATAFDGMRHAMLATAVSSVSMEPPSLLVCVNRSASAFPSLQRRGAFSLALLGADLAAMSLRLPQAKGEERFSQGNWDSFSAPGSAAHGLPWLRDAQATVFCETDDVHAYGTHVIFIGRVLAIENAGRVDPLLYCTGQYGRFEGIAR